MRVLWFTNTSSNYNISSNLSHNGGGWISSLQNQIETFEDIELGICFHMDGQPSVVKEGRTSYYPVPNSGYSIIKKIYKTITSPKSLSSELEKKNIEAYLSVISQFRPDIIQVFGSERYFGLIAQHTTIPVVLHIQGILAPCLNAFSPAGLSYKDYIFQDYKPFNIFNRYATYFAMVKSAERENRILKQIKYFMGRTKWDFRLSQLLSPQSKYYHCDEILREAFYGTCNYGCRKNIIATTISSPFYKGFDMILKTAKELKDAGVDFEWRIMGNINPTFMEKYTKIKHEDVNIVLVGVVDAVTLKQELSNASIYMHPSYIDNSPNGVCEAQIQGLPVVACNVGGVSTLVEENETGYLVPSNDPYQAAYIIKQLFEDRDKCFLLSKNAHIVASKRHNPVTIAKSVYAVYKDILSLNNFQ